MDAHLLVVTYLLGHLCSFQDIFKPQSFHSSIDSQTAAGRLDIPGRNDVLRSTGSRPVALSILLAPEQNSFSAGYAIANSL